MYIVDFFKRIARKSNIPVMIYLVINVFIISGILQVFFTGGQTPYVVTCIWAVILYALSLTVALSPFGEWILRLQNGAKPIKRADIKDYIQPIFDEVYAQARQKDPSIPTDVEIFLKEDPAPNAFATGRKTVCITSGLLQQPKGQIKGVLAHEFGHLAHKDTDLILLVVVGNFFITAVMTFIKAMIIITQVIMAFVSKDFSEVLISMLTLIFINVAMWIWTKIGVLLVMKSSRSNEYEADGFAFQLGYANDLCEFLDTVCVSEKAGVFAALASTHPDKNDRIARLQSFGATYRATF